MTDRGIIVEKGNLYRGQFSDLLGLFDGVSLEDRSVLRFFNKPITGMCQSKANHDVAVILSNVDNLSKWDSRPASQLQKAGLAFLNITHDKGINHAQADALIKGFREEFETNEYIESDVISESCNAALYENNNLLINDWNSFEEIYEEVNEPDTRDEHSIKKVTLSIFQKSISRLKSEGNNLQDLKTDIDAVIAKIIEIEPKILK
ncbi:hypothetical protein [Alteromonas stellipolaris]|uniref:hypothetical protein n=1 Tax=Alteromonas stellipolaris TaxID=233316 RepID=UPI001E43CDAB|nr:hypothetical protein [Alteromonas stellipolaris]